MIRVFVGTDSDIHGKAEKVVEYSIRKHATEPVEIRFIKPGWMSGCTGFTNHRFLVPSLCNYEGFAIYLDVDMLVLGDIAELWSYQTQGKWCTTPMRDDVSVIDCAAFADLTPEYVKTSRKDVIRKKIGGRFLSNISIAWNSIDEIRHDTKLIHYSDLDRQPWHPIPGHSYKKHPDVEAVELFWNYYNEAVL
jgi:hypothetical protein